MIDIKNRFGKRYRVYMDETWDIEDSGACETKNKDKAWYYELRGNYGKIYLYSSDNNLLAMYISSTMISNRIESENPDTFHLLTKTDDGSVFLFKPKDIDFAARLIRARKKKVISEKERERLKRIGKDYLFTRRRE